MRKSYSSFNKGMKIAILSEKTDDKYEIYTIIQKVENEVLMLYETNDYNFKYAVNFTFKNDIFIKKIAPY